jgi:hypothetical protein
MRRNDEVVRKPMNSLFKCAEMCIQSGGDHFEK